MMEILNAVLGLLAVIFLKPGVIVLALALGIVAVLALLLKVPFFVSLWSNVKTLFNNALAWAVKYPWVFVALGIFYFFDQSLFGFAVLILTAIILALERLGMKI